MEQGSTKNNQVGPSYQPTWGPNYQPVYYTPTFSNEPGAATTQQPRAQRRPAGMRQFKEGEFKYGLFDCFDNIGLCVLAYVYPCYLVGKTAEALDRNCFCWAVLCLIPLVNVAATTFLRGEVRKKNKIEGNCCKDMLAHAFCHLFALTQNAAEVQDVSNNFVVNQLQGKSGATGFYGTQTAAGADGTVTSQPGYNVAITAQPS